jgi:hypothetical protein
MMMMIKYYFNKFLIKNQFLIIHYLFSLQVVNDINKFSQLTPVSLDFDMAMILKLFYGKKATDLLALKPILYLYLVISIVHCILDFSIG